MAKKIDKDLKDALLLNPYKIWVGDDYYLSRRVQLALFNNGAEWKGSSKIGIHPETESGDIKAILMDDGRMSYDSRIINEVDFNGNQGIGYMELPVESLIDKDGSEIGREGSKFKKGDRVGYSSYLGSEKVIGKIIDVFITENEYTYEVQPLGTGKIFLWEEQYLTKEIEDSELPRKFKIGNIVRVIKRGDDEKDRLYYYGAVSSVGLESEIIVKLTTFMEKRSKLESFTSEGGWTNFYDSSDEAIRFKLLKTDPILKLGDKVEIVNATGLFKKQNGKIGEIVGVYNDNLMIDLEGQTMPLPFGIDKIKLVEETKTEKDGLVNAFFEKNKDKLKRIFENNPKEHKKLIESLDKLAEYEECTIKKPSNEKSVQEAKSRLMESIMKLK